jgi:hypothetical protein
VDLLIAAMPSPWQQVAVDTLSRRLRRDPSAGALIALSAARLAGPLHAMAGLCAPPVLLRGADEVNPARSVPGSGRWRDRQVQVARSARTPPRRRARFAPVGSPVAVVADAEDARTWRASLPADVPTASAAQWLQRWSELERLRAGGALLLLTATAAEVRALTGIDALPPLLDGPDRAWLAEGRHLQRVRRESERQDTTERIRPTG